MHKLTRNFVISSVLGLILTTALLGYIHQRSVIDNLIQQKINESTTLSTMLANDIWEEYSPYVADLSTLPRNELTLHFAVREFDSAVRARAVGLDILQISIYTLGGNTVFTTESQLLGVNINDSTEFQAAKSGKTATQLVSKALADAMNRTRVDRKLIINFLPLYDTVTRKVSAVLEIHTDITKSLAAVENQQTEAYGTIGVVLLVLIGTLLLVVKRADKLLTQHVQHIDLQQQHIEHQTYHDTLTGLPNRKLLRDRLTHAIELACQREVLVAVLVVNLDRFKNVNDTYGHAVGDHLLLAVVNRLRKCVRSYDTIARTSGDEFCIVLETISVIHEAEEIAALILDEFSSPLTIEGQELYVTPSIGLVIYPFTDDDIDMLIKKAGTAMYQAKEAGRNTFRLYDPSMVHQTVSRFSMENALRRALDRNEFELYYQPLIHLKTGNITAVETLLRWRSPEQGLISPLEFIPILEDTGLIMPVGAWVLETACMQTVAWQSQGFADLKVNVNLSPVQFLQKGIARQVRNALDQSGLQPHLLDLEITESLLIDDIGNIMPILDSLNEMGASLSIDDFGTGYSSLAYLKRMPIETLKIDRSFINDITVDVNDAAIVDAICAMASSLRFKVTAEGVETREQLEFLLGRPVDTVQGYLFSRPVPATELAAVLQRKDMLNNPDKVA